MVQEIPDDGKDDDDEKERKLSEFMKLHKKKGIILAKLASYLTDKQRNKLILKKLINITATTTCKNLASYLTDKQRNKLILKKLMNITATTTCNNGRSCIRYEPPQQQQQQQQ